MRTLKFRSWDADRKQYFYSDAYGLGNFFQHHGEDGCLEQYTGLKDVKGTEVYEGDILKTKITPNSGQHGRPRAVFFHEGAFKCGASSKSRRVMLTGLTVRQKDLTVIGNIHENPELLK